MAIIKPSKFLHVGIPVNDLVRAKEFYVDVLGLESTDGEEMPSSPHSPVRLHCGPSPDPGQQVVLFRLSPSMRDHPRRRATRTTPSS